MVATHVCIWVVWLFKKNLNKNNKSTYWEKVKKYTMYNFNFFVVVVWGFYLFVAFSLFLIFPKHTSFYEFMIIK